LHDALPISNSDSKHQSAIRRLEVERRSSLGSRLRISEAKRNEGDVTSVTSVRKSSWEYRRDRAQLVLFAAATLWLALASHTPVRAQGEQAAQPRAQAAPADRKSVV